MGIALSMKDNSFILNSLDQFLTPRLIKLKNLISESSMLTFFEQEAQIIFELGVMEQLVATLEANNKNGREMNCLFLKEFNFIIL